MKNPLQLHIQKFFKEVEVDPPFLLACSGGPDSMCLLHLMKKVGCSFSILYVDHGWREEAKEEANSLASLAVELGIPFYFRRVREFDFTKGNIEDRLRQERQLFYKEVATLVGASAIVTGHQKNDLTETTLKRLMEGAHLTELYGIKEVEKGERFYFLRPLLKIPKAKILEYLDSHNIPFFEDKTNGDIRYLRARMRSMLLPELTKHFGKEIEANLEVISHRSLELREYLDRKIAPYLKEIVFDHLPMCLPLKSLPTEKMEKTHLLRTIGKKIGVTLNREHLRGLLAIIDKGRSEKQIILFSYVWIVRKGALIIEREKSSQRKYFSDKLTGQIITMP